MVKLSAKVDPKAYFSNERNSLHWITQAVYLISFSTQLYGFVSKTGQRNMSEAFGNQEDAENLAQVVITCSCLVGFALMGYGTLLFYRRRKALISEDGAGPFVDNFGPIFFVIVSVAFIAINLVVSWVPKEAASLLNRN